MPEINEAPCPVDINLVARLLRSDDVVVRRTVAELPAHLRAQLAVFCAGRRHMRDLGLAIAGECGQQDLSRVAGVAGSVLFSQARHPVRESVDAGRTKPRVTLARLAS